MAKTYQEINAKIKKGEAVVVTAEEIIDIVAEKGTAKAAQEVFGAYDDAPTPCIMVVPFTTEPEGFATRSLGEALKMATGINILQNN